MIIGLGIDVVDVSRIQSLMDKYGNRFTERVFSKDEINYCMERYDSAACFAGRFAVKEAAFKALSAGRDSGIPFRDISVTMSGAAPQLHLSGKAHELAARLGISMQHVSISHDKGCAVAVVVLESK